MVRPILRLVARALSGEGCDVDVNDPTLVKKMDALRDKLAEYDMDNICNIDETGSFYRLLPHYSVMCPGEAMDASGKKPKKEQVTISGEFER